MYLLDTDTVSLLLRGHEQISTRVRTTAPELLWVSAITVEELLRGSLAVINGERTKRIAGLSVAYRRLIQMVQAITEFNLLPYDDEAEELYKKFGPNKKRVGTQDCRIAASALHTAYIVELAMPRISLSSACRTKIGR